MIVMTIVCLHARGAGRAQTLSCRTIYRLESHGPDEDVGEVEVRRMAEDTELRGIWERQ